jgi:hypothetical protein
MNEIKYSMSFAVTNGSLSDSYNASGLMADQASAAIVRNVQTIAVASAQGDALVLGGVATPGLGFFANLDDANFIEIGIRVSGTFYPFLKLLKGQQAGPVWMGTTGLYAKADTGNVKLMYVLYQA